MSGNDVLSLLSPREVAEALSDDNRWYAGAEHGIKVSDETALVYYWNATRVPKNIYSFTVHEPEKLQEA